MTTSPPLDYRPDIDGMRAIAVLAVVLFHLEIADFSGGYIGVDVFFVISGFLITAIIRSKAEATGFSFSQFYLRRIRRLLPALIATVAASFAGAAVIMTPYDLMAHSRSAVAALFSLSNVAFYLEAGYWDSASELKPLLHTWSLGVEEQFYLFWPAFIVALVKLRKRIPVALALGVTAIAGFVLSVWYTSVDMSAAFYLLPFRFFQFALGALALSWSQTGRFELLSSRSLFRYTVSLSGLALIARGVFQFDGDTAFPGWAVLAPTVGATLLLLGGCNGRQAPLLQPLLANRAMRWLGKVSYSMYLVHWPLIALYRYEYGLHLSVLDQSILAAATLLATLLLHYGIERRFYARFVKPGSTPQAPGRFAIATFVTASIFAIAPASAWLGDGWTWRYPDVGLTPAQIAEGMDARYTHYKYACSVQEFDTQPSCKHDKAIQVLVLGNSHEVDGYNMLRAGYEESDSVKLINFGTFVHCKDMRYENDEFLTSSPKCQARMDRLVKTEFMADIDLILYSANKPFSPNKQIFLDLILRLKKNNPSTRLITLGSYINTQLNCSRLLNESGSPVACVQPENVIYFADTPRDWPLYQDIMDETAYFIDRIDLLCKNRVLQTCATHADGGIPAFYDQHHHSLEFAELSGRLYARQHPELLQDLVKPGVN